MKMARPRIGTVKKWLASLAIVSVFSVSALRYFAPEVAYGLQDRWRNFRAGVHGVHWGEARGIERDLCEEGAASCHCVLFIHGMGDSSATWRRLFLREKSEIPEPMRLLAFDLPGMGETALPASLEDRQVKAIGGAYAAQLAKLQCSRTTIVGNSFGGWVAIWTAVQMKNAANLRTLSLAGIGLESKAPEDPFFTALQAEPTVDRLKEFQRRAYFKPRDYPDEFWESAVRRLKQTKGRDLRKAQSNAQFLRDEDLAGIHSFDYYWGEADRIVPREMGETIVRKIPGARFHLIPECGHLPQKECPELVWVAIIRSE